MLQQFLNIYDNAPKPCDQQAWQELISSPETLRLINECRNGNSESKKHLPAICVQGVGEKRGNDTMRPTGMYMLDFDYLSNYKNAQGESEYSPESLYAVIRDVVFYCLGIDAEKELVAAWKTARGNGLRVIMMGRKGSSIVADQDYLAGAVKYLTGIDYDKSVKDVARCCLVPSEGDIYYINNELMFAPVPEDLDYKAVGEENLDQQVEIAQAEPMANEQTLAKTTFSKTHDGVLYEDIVNKLIENLGGMPKEGSRNVTIFKLASHLRHITDDNAAWLAEIIPSFGLDEKEKRRTIQSALSKPIAWCHSRVVAAAIDELKQEKGEGSANQKAMEANMSQNPPQMPEKLPSLIELLTSKVPEHIKPAVAVSSSAALATHLSKMRYRDANNKYYEPSLMSMCVAPSSSGKASIDDPIKYILESIKAKDREYMDIEAEYMENAANQSSSKDKKKRPFVQTRILANNITNPTFVRRLKCAENRHKDDNGVTVSDDYCLYSHMSELEELNGIAGGDYRKVKLLIKDAWDRNDYGQDRSMPGAIIWNGPLRWNFSISTTPTMARRFFKNAIAEGTLSRILHSTIMPPKERISFKYEDYGEDFRNALRPYLDNLTATHGDKECAKIIALQNELNSAIEDVKEVEGNSPWVQLAWRSVQMMVKYLYILVAANDGVWEDSFENFGRWLFEYDMWVKFAIHGSNAKAAFGDDSFEQVSGKRTFLAMMPEVFTKTQCIEILQNNGCKSRTENIISGWKRDSRIVEIDKQVYKKVV